MGRLSDARKKARSAKEKGAQPAEETLASSAGEHTGPLEQKKASSKPASTGRKSTGKTGKAAKAGSAKKTVEKTAEKSAQKSAAETAVTSRSPADDPTIFTGLSPADLSAGAEQDKTDATDDKASGGSDGEFANVFPPASMSLPASGLADDILSGAADADEAEPVASKVRGESQLPASGLADDLLGAWRNREAEATKVGAATKTREGPATEATASTHATVDTDTDDWSSVLETLQDSKAPRSLPSSGLAEDILEGGSRARLGIDEIHEFENFFEEEEQAEQMHLVLFGMANELFALEMFRVQEIIRVPGITRVPHVEEYIRGVCNLRGRIVPVFDLRRMMGMPPKEIDKMSRIMVLDMRGKQIGMLIDRASEVARVDMAEIEPPPEEMRAIDRNLVSAVARTNERMIFILDVDRVMALH